MAWGHIIKRISSRVVTLSFLLFIACSFVARCSRHGQPSGDWSKDVLTQHFKASQQHPERRATPKLKHEYLSNGLLKTNLGERHPILELIEQAEYKWTALRKR